MWKEMWFFFHFSAQKSTLEHLKFINYIEFPYIALKLFEFLVIWWAYLRQEYVCFIFWKVFKSLLVLIWVWRTWRVIAIWELARLCTLLNLSLSGEFSPLLSGMGIPLLFCINKISQTYSLKSGHILWQWCISSVAISDMTQRKQHTLYPRSPKDMFCVYNRFIKGIDFFHLTLKIRCCQGNLYRY